MLRRERETRVGLKPQTKGLQTKGMVSFFGFCAAEEFTVRTRIWSR
jgi:hypothetical protein